MEVSLIRLPSSIIYVRRKASQKKPLRCVTLPPLRHTHPSGAPYGQNHLHLFKQSETPYPLRFFKSFQS